MGKSKSPSPPDPKETSAANTGTNIATGIANAYLQNPDQQTPFGSLSYELDNGQAYKWKDPYTGESYKIPKLTATQTLTAEGQQLQDRNTQTQLNLAQLAQDQSGFLNDYMAEPFSYSPGEYEGWALNLYDQLNGDKIDQDREALTSRLANQGIMTGSDAYSREMENFTGGQQDSRNKFLLDAYGTGMNTALTERNQPLREIASLMTGSQPEQPNFVNPNVAGIQTTDNAAIINNNYNQKMQQWQQNQAASGSMFSSLGGLFQGLGAAGLTLSDERAKTDKKKIGETKDGLGLYSFKYKGSDKTEVGLMAQEVKKSKPGAVKTTRGGLMAVDYGKALS